MYVYGTLSTGNRDADVLVKYIKNGGPVQTYTFSSKQLKNTVSSPYQLGLSVAPGDSYQWQYCANTEPYHGTGFSCSYLRSFTVANVINYTAPTVTLDLPTDGYTFGTGTTNVTLNFTVNAGTSATNHLVYFDGNEQPLCTYVTPANTSVAYNCTITITGGYSHNWYVNYYDDVYAGHTNTNTATRIFSINPPIIGSPASITIDSPTEYQKGTWNGTSTEWKFIPLINVNTYNESINLSFYVGSNLTYFNYYNTVQIPNTTINYSPGIYNAHCYGFLCNLQAHFVEGVTDTITYNTSRPFTIYANESYPYIKNNEPINQSTYAIGTTTIPFYGDSISCGDVECKNAYIYLIIDNEVPILVGTQNSTEIAKRWNYNKTGMTAGNHSYYWALDNTISGFGGTTISYDDRWNFIINASVAGWYPPDVNIISPPDGQTYTAGTTSVTLYANITTGSNATDTYFVFDGITYPKESGLIIPNTTREYLMVINVTTGTHTWTYWAEDYIANYTATSRTFTINASTTCTPDKGACTTNESCCSKLCSNGYCHYDTGFYEINIPVDDNGNPMLVSTDNPMCDPNISSNCGIIPQIYRGAFIIFAKIGHPMIILMSVVILCLFIIILGGFVIRVARGP